MKHSDHTFLGTTQSLCPECLALVPAKIIVRRNRVYFRKRCPTHGVRDDFICSDASQYDQLEYTLPSRLPAEFGVEPDKGCPYDCGLCTEHEQHTCVGLVEITQNCNLTCPMCYASSAPGGKHLSLAECQQAIDRLVEVEGRPEVLQLSGGEPTIHPQFEEIVRHALSRPIDYVMINTNGIRLAKDAQLVEFIGTHRDRMEVYFQFDGFTEKTSQLLRGESLVATKLAALEALGRAGVHTTLVTTLQGDVNGHEIGAIVKYAIARPWITAVSFQPATYSGRHVLPATLERRITYPDVIRALAEQTDGMFQPNDFIPLPCAHPNCHQITYAYRDGESVLPLARVINARENMDLLANGVTFSRPAARDLMLQYLGRQGCCGGNCAPGDESAATGANEPALSLLPVLGQGSAPEKQLAGDFFTGALAEKLGAENLFRITVTNFLDAYNFDVRRLMKCCIHHVLPSGHVIPFCAYNVLYRNGHVKLPELTLRRVKSEV